MPRKYSESRRDFLKKSVVGVTGVVTASSGINKVFAQGKSKGAIINPNINNLRVVYIEDIAMLQDGASTAFGTFTAASAKVKADVVKTNMDKMACALANDADAAKAWGIIFQKPASKAWGDVLIAIKPNCAAGGTTGQNYPHASIPIINAVCNALIALGAKATNMTIYDTNGFSVNPSTLYPAASMVSGIKFQGPATREYPVPVMSSISPAAAAAAAAAADIIIDIASCKGHATSIGSTTLTMKNHLGTVGGHATTAKQIIDIQNLDFNERSKTSLSWDARNKQGRIVSAGTYVLKLSGTNTEKL